MPHITISYRRDDTLDITGRIYDQLVSRYGEETVFRDIDNIPAGVDFRKHISTVLDDSNVVLAIVGPRWIGPRANQSRLANAADPVRVEIEAVLHKDKPLIPVLVLGASMPRIEQLPETMREFAYRHAVAVASNQNFGGDLRRLIRELDRILEGTTGTAAADDAALDAREPIVADAPADTAELLKQEQLAAESRSEPEQAASMEAQNAALHSSDAADAARHNAESETRALAQQLAALREEAETQRQRHDKMLVNQRQEIDQRNARIEELDARLKASGGGARGLGKIGVYWAVIVVLAIILAAMGISLEAKINEQQTAIVELGQKLNSSLAERVAILSEIKIWAAVSLKDTAKDYDEYLQQYPQGFFVDLARKRLAILRPAAR